jgi:hypothetical protein
MSSLKNPKSPKQTPNPKNPQKNTKNPKQPPHTTTRNNGKFDKCAKIFQSAKTPKQTYFALLFTVQPT